MVRYQLIDTGSDFNGYFKIIELYEQCKDRFFEDIFVSINGWFDANLCSVLGGVLSRLESGLNSINIEAYGQAKTILQKNRFLTHYGYDTVDDKYHTTIYYFKLEPNDIKFFSNYIHKGLLNRTEMPIMSDGLVKSIKESILELFANAKLHSETEHIHVCGQFYPVKNKIVFTLTDTGIGFKANISRRFKKDITSIQAIQWAVTNRNTTKENISGGVGLALLKEFIKHNKGKVQIISGNGLYQYSEVGEEVKVFPHSFPGSIVTVEFKTDDKYRYSLNSEI